nr:hypothetical protein [Tanacetum cinerariifolium]
RCHEPNSEGSGSAWKEYVNARVAGLFLLVLLEYPKGCRSSVRMTMHEVVHEMVVGECHEPSSEGSGSAWKAYMNARVAGLFLLVSLEYPNGKGVVCAMSRGLDIAPHWLGVGAAPLMSPRQDETSEPLLYARRMAGPYRCKDATRGRNDDSVTSGIRARLNREDSIWHHTGWELGLRQYETSEPLLYARRMVGPYRCKDAMRGRNDDLVTSCPNVLSHREL